MEEVAVHMEDFMDVVTTYRCKFCSFTSTHPQGIGDHVRKVHLTMVQTLTTDGDTVQSKADGEATVTLVAVDTLPVAVPCSIIGGSTVITPLVSAFGSADMVSTGTTTESESLTAVKTLTSSSTNDLQDYNTDSETSATDGNATGTVDVNAMTTSEADMDKSPGSATIDEPTESELVSKIEGAQITKELFLCGQCGIGFSTVEACKRHMVLDHNINADQSVVADLVDVATQVERKRPGRKKKVEIVVKQDSDEDWDLEVERRSRLDGRVRRRTRPPKALKEDYYLGRHKKKERVKPEFMRKYTFKCTKPSCLAKFKQEETLQKHIQSHIPNSYDFKCFQCSQTFSRWKAARFHLWKKHDIDMDLLSCDECTNYKTDTLHKLRLHKQIHSDDKPYTCDVCGKGFRQISQMRNHQMIHSEHRDTDPTKWYTSKQCKICKRVFANQKCVKVHMLAVHGKVRPFLCPHCGYTATRKAMLQLHLRTHTGEKPFKCDVCPYTTGDHNSLRRHKMRHTGLKPYKCQHCMYSCIQSISLKTHMKNKHSSQDGVYCCHTCSFRTINETNYKNHVFDHENGIITEMGTKLIHATSEPPGLGGSDSKVHELQMQVASVGSQKAQISAEDLAKLSSCEGLVSSDISVAQLIYSALSAVSQNEQNSENQSHMIDGVETSISSSCSGDGTTSHTITFHLPVSEGGDNKQTRQSETILVTSKTIDNSSVAVEEDIVQIAANSSPINVLMGTVDGDPVTIAKTTDLIEVITDTDIVEKIQT